MPTPWRNETNTKTPCYKCTEREIGCHGNCEKYAAFSDERKKHSAEHLEEQNMRDYRINANERCKKTPSKSFRRPKK